MSFLLRPVFQAVRFDSLSCVRLSLRKTRLSSCQPTLHHANTTLNLHSKFASSSSQSQIAHKENIFTVPNVLCVGRIAVAPYLAYIICQNGDYNLALALFGVAGLTDLLDGWIARNVKGQSTMLGSFLDPLADKILVGTLFLSLTYVNLIPSALTMLVVSRDLLLIYAGLYIRYMGVSPPFTIKKYLDVRIPSAQVQPTTISKLNTCFQLGLVATALAAPVLGIANHPLLYCFCGLTAGTTFASAVSYAFQKNTYKFSSKQYDHQFFKKLSAFIFFVVLNLGFSYYTLTSEGSSTFKEHKQKDPKSHS